MYGRLWLFVALASGFVGLGIGLYVLVNIFQEAVERRAAGEPTPPDPERQEQPPAGIDAQLTDQRVCPNCQTVNDPSFEYCSECAAKL